MARSGVEAWVRLRERFSKTTGATSYAVIFKYNWASNKSFEDKCRKIGCEDDSVAGGFFVGFGKGGCGHRGCERVAPDAT